jgi:hypothetical protein
MRGDTKAVQPVTQDVRLKPGDALRFSYVASSNGYLAILDFDATGKATAFYPFGGNRPAAVSAKERALLPGSIILDNTAGYEWLVAVFSPTAFEIEPLLRQLEKHPPGATVHLSCQDCRVESLRIQKGP